MPNIHQRRSLLYAPAVVVAASTLRTGMESYWDLSEASGTRADSHGSNDLGESFDTVGTRTGIGGSGVAADMPGAGGGGILSATDSASISTGNIDWSLVFWCIFDNLPTNVANVIWKNGEYRFGLDGSNVPFIQVFDAVSGDATANASTFGALSTATWYMISIVSEVGVTVRISVNAGAQNTDIHDITGADSASDFQAPNSDRNVDGGLQFMGFWKKALTTDEITELYNSGAGLNYASTA